MNIPEVVTEAVELVMAGQFEKSERLLKKVFRKDPENFDAMHASALADIGKAQPRRGLKKLKKLMERATPAQSRQLTNSIGLAYKGLGDFESAIDCFREVYNARPDSFEAGMNLAVCLEKLQRYREAIDVCRLLSGTFENNIDVEMLALNCRYHGGEVGPALDGMLALAKRKTMTLKQYEQTCYKLEHHYRYEDLRALAAEGLKVYPDAANMALNIARCDLEENRNEDALAVLELAATRSDTSDVLANLYHEIGLLHDKAGRYHDALRAFTECNDHQRKIHKSTRVKPSRSVASYKRALERGEVLENFAESSARNAGDDLSFLIGFPRSGTTLLERVLDSHTEINALPEVDFVYRMVNHLGGSEKYPFKLKDLDESDLNELEEIYRNSLLEFQPDGYKLTVDKMPLNMIHVPLIHRVFPRAKFILALRHPADCTLSCFMQNFVSNEEMAHFTTLASTTHRYADVFSLWNTFREILPLEIHEIRYEDLVANFDKEVESMMQFLDLGVQSQQARYHEDAIEKGGVRTPSYRQVSKPIYASSSYRWKNYAFAMEEHLPVLQPFIEQFGYGE